jgi:alkanesulfonate monooxygenase SsuD/methylene tetrahydromethanopterin reductase-like flavin-dependent oxidoreductase (luciferase family)
MHPLGPPIWVGGSSEGARRRAGTFGRAWHPVGISASELATQAPLVQQAAHAVGREAPVLAPRLPVQFGVASEALAVGRMQTINGSPDEIVKQLRDYEDAGVSELVCLFNSPDGCVVVDQMELLAKHVMPVLAENA